MNRINILVNFIKFIYRRVRAVKKIGNVFNENYKKHVLISYTISPFLGQSATHTNHQESIAIAEIFDEIGYCVDIVNYTNERHLDYSKYDVIFGFGEPFENSFESLSKIHRIYYATGAHVCYQNHAEIKRVASVNVKYGVNARPKRIVPWMWSQSTTMSDLLIVIGNEWTKSTYSAHTEAPIFNINATALVNRKSKDVVRDIQLSRNNFIWFGSSGLIHKGLDLCLEYFSANPKLQLHICGPEEDDFFKTYKYELNQKNIHYHGFIDVQSDEFIKIISQCSFAVLPTCSEGQATALLTAMGAGLIPITTIYSGIDVQKYGFLIRELDVERLGDAIAETFLLSKEEINCKSRISNEAIQSEHTLMRFKQNLKRILLSGVLN